ncbi:MAG TPA: LPS export ABC transporter permease LptG [Desulfobacteraceae bacterium]|nr:LPS export ABC transporter permease LptG [Desulfobacteraceae bacterium]HPJ68703.1 LPS export ABC transporter permease LptG [Desulfobacteraceae bacterium]HPQ29174.1 LPS export ABC transporter permease LptG [Desulfobacteraceae bacterium]
MGILSRYLLREFLKLFVLFLFAFLTLYLIVDFIQKIDDFNEANAHGLMLTYFFFKAPLIVSQMIPVTTLLSVIVMFSQMKKHNEIMAMKSCGMSIFKISKPVIAVSILLSISVFLFSELIIPYTSARSNHIWHVDLDKSKKEGIYGQNCIWYKGKDSIYWIGHFDSQNNIMKDVTFYFFDAYYKVKKRIDARTGVWNGDSWELKEGIIQKLCDDGGYDFKRFAKTDAEIPEGPEAFVRTVKLPEEMSYWQLKRYAEKVRLEGYDAAGYLVDMNIKLAFPMINLIMTIIGIVIALGVKKGGTPVSVSAGVVFCFLYLVTLGFMRALGISGVLPPGLSAWMANIIFLLIGVYLMIHLRT